jgi:hypothetical protein
MRLLPIITYLHFLKSIYKRSARSPKAGIGGGGGGGGRQIIIGPIFSVSSYKNRVLAKMTSLEDKF